MADSSLEDFFAKKDKSKKKSKSKVTPGDILSKQEKELAVSKKEKKKKDKEKQQNSEGTQNTTDIPPVRSDEREDEEWVDFEQEIEKDYTGLRIQNLQISKDEQAPEEENKESEDEDEHDENGEKKESKESGPWNKSQGQQQQQASAPAPPVTPTPVAPPVEEPKEATPAKTPGKYVPPGARAGATAEPTRPTPLRKKRIAPNLHSEEDFPTLGGPGGNTADQSDGRGTIFEKVHSGGRNAEDPVKLQSLSLGNKFSALQD